jgi:hypothetical protein
VRGFPCPRRRQAKEEYFWDMGDDDRAHRPPLLSSHSAHPSPSLDRLLQHLVGLVMHGSHDNNDDHDDKEPPARLEPDLARHLLDWLRRLRAPLARDREGERERLAGGLVAVGQQQGWSYDVVEGLRLLACGPGSLSQRRGVAPAADTREEEEEEEEVEEEEEEI